MTFNGEAGLALFFMSLIGVGAIASWLAWQLNRSQINWMIKLKP
jgi:predicted negative regulator of RcsB-dependent stress response